MKHTPGLLLDTLGRRNRKYPDMACSVCGKQFRPRKKESKFCSRKCMYKGRITPSVCIPGPDNPLYKGGWIDQKGYREIKVDGKPKRLHRYIMEQHVGRKLLPHEDVHHINGNKLDNRIENLEIIKHGDHSLRHNLNRKHKRGYKLNLSTEERRRRSEYMKNQRKYSFKAEGK